MKQAKLLAQRLKQPLPDTVEKNLEPIAVQPEKKSADEKIESGSVLPAVSIVIPTFNNFALMRKCLDALFATTPSNSEIIVVDNSSTDGSLEFLREQENAGRLRLISNPRNEGFARACNRGAQTARNPLLLFLNNDTETTAGWLDALVAAAQLPDVGIAGAKLLYADDTIQHAGIGFINGIPDHPHRRAPADAPEANRFRELDMVTGACLMIRRELFLQLAGFDETFRNGVEDIDLCLRARAAGWKIVYEPKSVVYHLEGQSTGRFKHINDNLQIFFNRWSKSFDGQKNFIPPAPPKIIAAERSLLLESSKKISVAWIGSFLDHGSLSHVNRELSGALKTFPELNIQRVTNGAPVSADYENLARQISATAPPDTAVTIRHAWPPDWKRPAAGKLVVIQPWEFGALPEDWVHRSRDVDEFWVPSNFVRNCYVESGVAAEKVFVVPNGVDAEKFHPQAVPMKLAAQKKFKFLFVGGTIGRKGPDLLLEAFLKTFTATDDVCLVIKDFGGKSFYQGQTFAQQIQNAQAKPGAPEILYLDAELPPESLPGLYTACDCLVHPYRGEGFGLPVLEAMACGLPVIVTAGGATDDFVRDEFARRIPATKKIFGDEAGGMKLAKRGWLLEPDIGALAAQMKWVAANREAARDRGSRAAEFVRREWTWKRAAQIAAQRLQNLAVENNSATAKPSPMQPPPVARLGKLDEARSLLQRRELELAWKSAFAAVSIRPFHPEGFLLLAEIALAAGAGKSAKLFAQRARDLAPNWKTPKQFLQKNLNGSAKLDWLNSAFTPNRSSSPRLSVCLIVKNEEKFLTQCLSSVKAIAHQIVVVDTGSTDRTVEIAKSFGAEIYPFAWRDDFSAARNAALEHATGDWILMLDADEELPAAEHAHLCDDMKRTDIIAFRLPLVNKGEEAQGKHFVPRLFRNTPGVYYYSRIHEQVFPSLIQCGKAWGMKTAIGTAQLLHHGYAKEVIADRNKVERNLKLLRQAVREFPDDANLQMNLGLELVHTGDLPAALTHYREAFRLMSAQPPTEVAPELREVLLTQFTCHLYKMKAHEEVVQTLNSPLAKQNALTASLHFALGLAFFELKKFHEAAEEMRQCLAKRKQPSLAPINTDIFTAMPHHCLALSLMKAGDAAGAEKVFQTGLAENANAVELKLDYAKFLAGQNRPVEALQQLNELVTANPCNTVAWRLGGEIALGNPEFLEFARDWTAEAIRQLPDDAVITAQRAEALLLSQQAAAALPLWTRAVNGERPARSLAAQIICAAMAGQPAEKPRDISEEAAVSRAFVDWYRRLVATGARDTIVQLNSRVEMLRPILPSAAGVLDGVIAATSK
ncbi:MAG TPA: glycosyltransferase [Verrucomicrobiae bacterium]|nr:glycosyltransferase [Verrucomicrobiae bacterium]